MKDFTRKQMKEAMRIRGFSDNTVKIYISHMISLAEFFNKAPHTLTPDDIQRYQVFLVDEKKVAWSTFNQSVCAMRFFLSK